MVDFIQWCCELFEGLFDLIFGILQFALVLVFLGGLAAVLLYICGLGFSLVKSVL
jgi:hypothetical protein